MYFVYASISELKSVCVCAYAHKMLRKLVTLVSEGSDLTTDDMKNVVLLTGILPNKFFLKCTLHFCLFRFSFWFSL